MMSLNLKKVKYSSRHGYSFEWQEPGGVSLTAEEVWYLRLLLEQFPPEEIIDREFTLTERKTIQRFAKLCFRQMEKISAQYQQRDALAGLLPDFRKRLRLFQLSCGQEFQGMIETFLGWTFFDIQPPSGLERLLREKLASQWASKHDFVELLKRTHQGEVSPEILAEIEERYGPLDAP